MCLVVHRQYVLVLEGTGPHFVCVFMCKSEMIQKPAAKLQHSSTYYVRPLAVLCSLPYPKGWENAGKPYRCTGSRLNVITVCLVWISTSSNNFLHYESNVLFYYLSFVTVSCVYFASSKHFPAIKRNILVSSDFPASYDWTWNHRAGMSCDYGEKWQADKVGGL